VATGKELHQIAELTRETAVPVPRRAMGSSWQAVEHEGPIGLWDWKAANLAENSTLAHPGILRVSPFVLTAPNWLRGGPTSTNVIHIWNMVTRSEIVQCRGH